MFYGTAMVLLHVVTGLKWYALPGLALVLLAVTSRYLARKPEEL